MVSSHDSTRLLNCPFCGESNMQEVDVDGLFISETRNGWSVGCRSCETFRSWYITRQDAVRSWNTRAPAKTAGCAG